MNFQTNQEKPLVFSLPFTQPKQTVLPNHSPLPSNQSPANISCLGISAEGQKSINDLMSFYDNNLHQQSKSPCHRSTTAADDQISMQPPRIQIDDNIFNQGVGTDSSLFEESSNSMNNQLFLRDEIQYDQCKFFEQPFTGNPNDNTGDFRFGSPFNNFPSMDFTEPVLKSVNPMPKQENSFWYF